MLNSGVATRRLLSVLASRSRIAAAGSTSLRGLSSDVPPLPPPRPIPSEEQSRPQKETPEGVSPVEATRIAKDDGEARRNGNRSRPNEGAAGKYEETQARVFIAALPHTARLGWTESALIAGARDVGVSPAIVGSIPRKDAALVEFFMDYCLQKLIEKVESGDELKNELKDLTLSDRLTKLIRIRLEMQAPYIAKWPQALSIQAQPANLPNNFKQRAELIDEIWHAAGDSGSDFDWYLKRTILGGIYSTTEVYMLTDHSPDFRDTWVFLDRRVKDAFDLQKTVQEAAYLAEAVGAGVGNTVKGFMAGIFPGSK
ncbi:ubiquinone biosynthesis protein COQ9-B, mitochondrial-like [Zingiber officinale]|uniref:ubiquinone biosynthesis protein COQ9-B, mitochondrial-like n=1 Tax=Zingiber officinale TaxID=94328 RepID=UPI001C4D5503|nr:ubiquinone biosynthesis protein COQ9-B, mitochondrial-like [Zingiber officinale]